jgi:hypothetical protein
VDTAALFATLDAVRAQPAAARFRFSVRNRWISGSRNRNEISTWLRVPVLDADGQIAHRRGVTDVPGLHVLGLRFLYRRDSNFIDGVERDARFLAARITA